MGRNVSIIYQGLHVGVQEDSNFYGNLGEWRDILIRVFVCLFVCLFVCF